VSLSTRKILAVSVLAACSSLVALVFADEAFNDLVKRLGGEKG
jgi:hypothetical protein